MSFLLLTILSTLFACKAERIEGTEPGDCTDGADNDADGDFDCKDDGCDGAPACEDSDTSDSNEDTGNNTNPDTGDIEDASFTIFQTGTGTYDYVTDMKIGTGNNFILSGSYNEQRAFVAKYSSETEKIWEDEISTSGDSEAISIALDQQENILVAGTIEGDLEDSTSTGVSDVFVRKYAADGSLLWSKLFGSTSHDAAFGIATDSTSNVYVTAVAQGLFGDDYYGGVDVVVFKLNVQGELVWKKQFGTPEHDRASSIVLDSENNVYVVGTTQGSLDGVTSPGVEDLFLLKLNESGEQLWLKQMTGGGKIIGRAIATDGSNAYVTGTTNTNFFGSTEDSWDIFVGKFSPQGDLTWGKNLGAISAGRDANGIAIDSQQNVYIGGTVNGSIQEQFGGGWNDFLCTKLNATGEIEWTYLAGFNDADFAYDDLGIAVALDQNEDPFLAGYTSGSIGGENQGSMDIFIANIMALW